MLNSRLGRYGGRPVALAVLMVVVFLTFLDNTVVSVVLGSVQADLHAGVTFLQWVVSAYALTFASAMLACGMVGDEFGRKRVMLSGGGGLLCWFGAVRAGSQRPGADRRAGGHGPGCRGQRARDAVHVAAPLP